MWWRPWNGCCWSFTWGRRPITLLTLCSLLTRDDRCGIQLGEEDRLCRWRRAGQPDIFWQSDRHWTGFCPSETNHSLHTAISRQRSSFSERLLSLSFSKLQTKEIVPLPWHLALQQLTGTAIKQRRALDNVENWTYTLLYPHHTSWTQRNTFTYWTLVCTKCVCVSEHLDPAFQNYFTAFTHLPLFL